MGFLGRGMIDTKDQDGLETISHSGVAKGKAWMHVETGACPSVVAGNFFKV